MVEGMPPFGADLDAAKTRWDAAVVLLETWRARPPGSPLERNNHEGWFYALFDEVRAHFDALPSEVSLSGTDRKRIISWTSNGDDYQKVDAVGHGLNFAASTTFAQSWRARLGVDRHKLADGEIYPVADAPWPRTLGGSRRTPAPSSFDIDDDDHPFARGHRAGPVEVTFDFAHWSQLLGIASSLDVVAALVPNEELGELGLATPRPVAFPVLPVDKGRQREAVLRLLEEALATDARVVLLPELSTWPELADEVAERLAADSLDRLVVCGSWHAKEGDQRVNVAEALLSGRPERIRHRKIHEVASLFPKDPKRRGREGIDAPVPPALTIHVADRFRFCLTVCKDFLHPEVADALKRVGANVLLVPSMSRTTQPFKSRAAEHITASQAVSMAVNGPRRWDGETPEPTALVSRPYNSRDVIPADLPAAPGMIVFSVVSGEVTSVGTK